MSKKAETIDGSGYHVKLLAVYFSILLSFLNVCYVKVKMEEVRGEVKISNVFRYITCVLFILN